MDGVAEAFAALIDRYGRFFRTRTRDNVAVAGRYLSGLAQAEDCTLASMAAVVESGCEQQFQHFISNSPWDHDRWWRKSRLTRTVCWAASQQAA